MSNLEIWDKVKRPPAWALKPIPGAARLTDVKPQWRYQMMTEVFGPCGTGWGYTIDKVWREDGVNGEVMSFAIVTVIYQNPDGSPTTGVPGIGGSKLVKKSRDGLENSDEGYKMAVTDAISTALQKIGVASDIYMGNWDGSKYKTEHNAIPAPPNTITVKKDYKPPEPLAGNSLPVTIESSGLKASMAAITQPRPGEVTFTGNLDAVGGVGPGDKLAEFGKFKGKRLKEIALADLRHYRQWLGTRKVDGSTQFLQDVDKYLLTLPLSEGVGRPTVTEDEGPDYQESIPVKHESPHQTVSRYSAGLSAIANMVALGREEKFAEQIRGLSGKGEVTVEQSAQLFAALCGKLVDLGKGKRYLVNWLRSQCSNEAQVKACEFLVDQTDELAVEEFKQVCEMIRTGIAF